MLAQLPCACATARQVARVLTKMYDAKLRPLGMESPQFALMMILGKLGPTSQHDLGALNALDKTTVSRNLKLLERNGWVAMSIGEDRRVRNFALTRKGRRQLAAALPLWTSAQQELRLAMTANAWDEMFRAFRDVLAATA